jgi:PAP2 superfamily
MEQPLLTTQPANVRSVRRFSGASSVIWLVLALMLLLQSCRKQVTDDAVAPQPTPTNPVPMGKAANLLSSDVATKWATLHLKLAKTSPGATPPVVSRAVGYAGLALYEAVVPGMTEYRSLVGQVQSLTALPLVENAKEYNWGASANAAQAQILRSLYANTSDANKATIDSLEAALTTDFLKESAKDITDRSAGFGKAIANAIFAYAKTDGGHEGYNRNFPADYVVPVGVGLWIPTGAQKIPMQPTWGRNRVFVRANATVSVVAPTPYSTNAKSDFFKNANEVYQIAKTLTDEQKEIALFWADDPGKTFTPPAHAMSILTQIIQDNALKLNMAAEGYAKIGMATTDAFVCCWRVKYQYNLIRPVSYINLAIDPKWSPLLSTPPFPEYTSGHSSGSGAAAAVFANLFAEAYNFTDRSHDNRGLKPRSFKSFSDYANEAAMSRLYGGIHYRESNERGLSNGRLVAQNVLALKWKK